MFFSIIASVLILFVEIMILIPPSCYAFSKEASTIDFLEIKMRLAQLNISDQIVRAEILKCRKLKSSLLPRLLQFRDRIDRDNESALKKIIHVWGWPDEIHFGKQYAQTAWLIALHSHDLKFQYLALRNLRRQNPSIFLQSQIAYLEDKIHVKQQIYQRYGTQGYCAANHQWLPFPIADRKHLDQFRLSMGLCPYSCYLAVMNSTC